MGDEPDAETRRNAVAALVQVCETVGIAPPSPSQPETLEPSTLPPPPGSAAKGGVAGMTAEQVCACHRITLVESQVLDSYHTTVWNEGLLEISRYSLYRQGEKARSLHDAQH